MDKGQKLFEKFESDAGRDSKWADAPDQVRQEWARYDIALDSVELAKVVADHAKAGAEMVAQLTFGKAHLMPEEPVIELGKGPPKPEEIKGN